MRDEATRHECDAAELEAEVARLSEENKKAVYGCCEECRYAGGLEAEVARLGALVRIFARQLIDANVWDFAGWTPDIMADLDPAEVARTERRSYLVCDDVVTSEEGQAKLRKLTEKEK